MYDIEQERKFIFSIFNKEIAQYRNKRIALYGTGENTIYIMKNIKDFNIVAIMDQTKVGEKFCGLSVISDDEAKKMVDVIVIVARNEVIPIIYKRISFLENEKITIIDIGGNVVSDELNNKIISENKYWNNTLECLLKTIDENDIISFDIFDTLIMRKILRVEKEFDFIEKVIKNQYNIKCEFKKYRMKAAEMAANEDVNPTLKQIYEKFKLITGINNHESEKIMNIELDIERKITVPRKTVVAAMRYALDKGKKVYLISDMYLEKKQIEKMLNSIGIQGYTDIIVSCEVKKSKWPNGDLFLYYKNKYKLNDNKYSLLHIGDNYSADIKCSNIHNINSFYIMNSYEMLVQSSLSELLVNNVTIEDEIILGIIAAKLFNDPFALAKYNGKLNISEMDEMGYIGYGPLLLGFTNWIINKYKGKKNYNLLFLARDGYLPIKIYDKIINEMNIKSEMPKGIYTLASRRALIVAALRTEDDIEFAVDRIDYKAPCKDILKLRFGIEINKDDKHADEILDKYDLKEYILLYKNEIIKNSKKEREKYLEYLKSIDAINENKIIVFDTQTIGTSAYYIEKILEKEIELVCFIKLNYPNYSLHDLINSDGYLGEDVFYLYHKKFAKSVILNDCILTSPDPQFVKINEANKKVYETKDKNQLNFNNIENVHNGIMEFIDDYLRLIRFESQKQEISTELLDDLNGVILSDKVVVNNDLKKYFGSCEFFAANKKECKPWN